MKHPLVHAFAEQTEPVPHALPSLTGLHATVDEFGWQVWQAFAGSFTPLE